jgi:DNA-binding transcriptional regulator YiaG
VISDGPYGMSKAAWDKMSLDDLPAWYAPHIEAWGRLCMPSASVYLWNTAAGWARLDPVMRAAGWTFRALVTWDKGLAFLQANHADLNNCRTWKDVTEVCGFYQRSPDFGAMIAKARKTAGLTRQALAKAVVGTPSGAVWNWENGQDADPINFAHALIACGDTRHTFEIAEWYEAARVPFTLPPGITNVWSAPQVGGMERLRGPDGKALHPCQKPLTFFDRMIRASTNPGDLVLEPFGGTLRVAVACERMPEPDARRYVCIEPDQDGRDYIAAVLPSLRLELPTEDKDGQIGLFAPTPCAPASEPV